MKDYYLARVLHVVGVVLWIGGVAFVTAVLLPAVKRMREPAEQVKFFENVEAGFACQARVARAQREPERTFSIIARMHWVLLAVSVITIAGAAAGSHGWSFGQ